MSSMGSISQLVILNYLKTSKFLIDTLLLLLLYRMTTAFYKTHTNVTELSKKTKIEKVHAPKIL